MTALCTDVGPDRPVHYRDRDGNPHTSPNPWFPEAPHIREQAVAAKAICDRCDERAACLAGAVERDEQHGIWGGVDFTVTSRGRSEAQTIRLRARPLAPINHGTVGGRMAHYRRGEPVCDPCRHAWNDHQNARNAERRQGDAA